MFSCRTKLENCKGDEREEHAWVDGTDVVVFEMRAEDGAAELADVGNDKADEGMWARARTRRRIEKYLVPSSVQLMNCEDLGSLIILRVVRHKSASGRLDRKLRGYV